jgi:ABC-type Fe3+ transport system permease subunit
MPNSSVSLMTAIITAVIVFFFGVAWTTLAGAKKSYKTAKGGVGTARKSYWTAVASIVKIGVWLTVLVIALVAWQVHDIRTVDDSKPNSTPTSSHPPSPSASRR